MSRRSAATLLLGLVLVVDSFVPWYSAGASDEVSSWGSPHAPWTGVLLCLAVVAGRLWLPLEFGSRFGDLCAAALVVVAFVMAGWGWLSEVATEAVEVPGPDAGGLVWQLQDQGADSASSYPLSVAWGYPVGLCVIALVAVVLASRSFGRGLDGRAP